MSIIETKRDQIHQNILEIPTQLDIGVEELKRSDSNYYNNVLIERILYLKNVVLETIQYFNQNTPKELLDAFSTALRMLTTTAIPKRALTDIQSTVIDYFTEKFEVLIKETKTYDKLVSKHLFDDYYIIRKLGEGSFGAVYESCNSNGDKFAVKVIVNPPESAVEEIKIMEHFSKTCSAKTPLVCLIESRIVGNKLFVVMEYLKGYIPLSDFIKYEIPAKYPIIFESSTTKKNMNASFSNQMNLETLNNIANNLCDAVEFLHSYKIAHNDLKSENVMINTNTFQIKIIDYGESCYMDECNVNHGFTLMFLDPLIYQNFPQNRSIHRRILHMFTNSIDLHKSKQGDLWSLGCIIYEIFTGYLPVQFFKCRDQNTLMDEYFARYKYKYDPNRNLLENMFKMVGERRYDLNVLLSRHRRYLK